MKKERLFLSVLVMVAVIVLALSACEKSDGAIGGNDTVQYEPNIEVDSCETTDSNTADDETTDGETTASDTADDETTDSDTADDETTDSDTADGETTNGETADSETMQEETTSGENVECDSHTDQNGDGKCDMCNYQIIICVHSDGDNDGKCDNCQISVIIEVDLFAINDLHGKFLASDAQPGVGGLTTYLNNAKAENPNTIMFSSGDMWQGSAESGLSRGKIINDWMKELSFAFMTIGNHEFDWGGEYIASNASESLPFLGINIYDKTTNKRVDYAKPSVIIDTGEVQVGFIGAIGDCLSSISGEYTGNLTFIVGDELTALIMAESDRLRAAGADIVVLSIHSGGSGAMSSDYDTSLSNGYIDIVFEAHSHNSYALQDKYGVWHLQAGGDNTTGIYNVDVAYNSVTGSFTVVPTLIKKSVYGALAEHGSIEGIKEINQDAIDKATSVIGTNSTQRNSNFLRNLIAQLYAQAGEDKWGDEYNIVLGGGFLSCRSPGVLYAGEITYGDLYMLFPFDNAIALCYISGSKLNSNFINTSNSNYYVSLTEYGNTVKKNIASGKTYYIVTDSYTYSYSSNRLTVVEKYVDYTTTFVYARDLLAEYIKTGGLR